LNKPDREPNGTVNRKASSGRSLRDFGGRHSCEDTLLGGRFIVK
jgi:hypothetical protein